MLSGTMKLKTKTILARRLRFLRKINFIQWKTRILNKYLFEIRPKFYQPTNALSWWEVKKNMY